MTNKKDEIGKREEIKVIDRRRIDAEGRDVEKGNDSAAGNGSAPSKSTGKGEGGFPEIDFSSFVMSFATQALMQLGEIKPPEGVDIPIDVNAAKQTIDILTMLQKKTQGNLDPREASLVEEILHNLRITFIRVSKGK